MTIPQQARKKKNTPKTAAPARMTRKHALGVLHRLYKQYIEVVSVEQFLQERAFREEIIDAFATLAINIHGQPNSRQSYSLCDKCHETYSHDLVDTQEASEGKDYLTCCDACRDRLLARGVVVAINGNPVAQPEREQAPHKTLPRQPQLSDGMSKEEFEEAVGQ
jgi:cysteinyl-tRNA synthetase